FVMNWTIETVAMQSDPAQIDTKDFTQTLKNDILGGVRGGLVGQRQAAQQAGNVKEVAKLDQAIAKIDKQLAADAQTQATPVAPQPPVPPIIYSGTRNPYGENYIPPQAVDIVQALGTTLVFCVVGFPLAKAFARWIDRRGTVAAPSREIATRLEAIEQAVESVAVEVERISEGQRFTAKLLNERTQQPASEFVAAERDPISSLPANSRRS
ncbi:MAG: hypothetical protein ABJC26_17550, partial [Gemmatimonadaceae bacterium]